MKRLLLLPAIALLAAFGPGDRSPAQLFERPKSWIPERKPVDPLTAVVPDPRDKPSNDEAEKPAGDFEFPTTPSAGACPADHVVAKEQPPNPLFQAVASIMAEHRNAGRHREALAMAAEAEQLAVCSAEKMYIEVTRAIAHESLGDGAAQLVATEKLLAMPYVQRNPINKDLREILEHDRRVLRARLNLPD